MSEPITLYRDGETVTTCAPSEAQRLIAEGWTHEQGQQETAQGKQREIPQEGKEEGQAVEPDPQFVVSASLMDTLVTEVTPKRGRPAKR